MADKIIVKDIEAFKIYIYYAIFKCIVVTDNRQNKLRHRKRERERKIIFFRVRSFFLSLFLCMHACVRLRQLLYIENSA